MSKQSGLKQVCALPNLRTKAPFDRYSAIRALRDGRIIAAPINVPPPTMSFESIESVLSVRLLDADNLSNVCNEAAINEAAVQAMIDAFRPLSSSLEIYVSR